MADPYSGPEAAARRAIDRALADAGWAVQSRREMNLYAAPGVAVREFPMRPGHGQADYLLFAMADGKPRLVGVVEAKKAGATLAGVEWQSRKYVDGLPGDLGALTRPLPFAYESTGIETFFTCGFDPVPRSRRVFSFHRPETLAGWLADWRADADRATLRARLRFLPELEPTGLRRIQFRAINAIEASISSGRDRALAQMATGSGKTFLAANLAYRLVRHAGARRVLFLVDRANLGRQTLKEFQQFSTPDDGRKLTELYNVQHLQSSTLDPAARVVITTVQRLYAMLRGEELPADVDELSGDAIEPERPVEVAYNPAVPIEAFDVVIVDECHRSIYGVWRQVLEYFDAFLIGLTATPAKQTFGFFQQNLVVEYSHDQAVADGVNVDFDVYRIRTRIGERGSTVEAGLVTKFRDRETRAVRLEKLDEDVAYDADALDRSVVSEDQIRTVVRSLRDVLFTELFPGRSEVPKTLIFAKSDSHADDIVRIVRDEFGKGNDFAVKITYRTTGAKPEDLLQAFRNAYNPRIAVTVDMIATGTDVKPLECVVFMRAVKSRIFFEQMKGRGVRTIEPNDLQAVTPDVRAKTHFVLVDCVGVTDGDLVESQPLERRKAVSLERLLDQIAAGVRDPDVVSSVAARLARLDQALTADDRAELEETAGGATLADLAGALVQALDPDVQVDAAREASGLAEPSAEAIAAAAQRLIEEACRRLAANPELRAKLVEVRRSYEQLYDETSRDEVLEAGYSVDGAERARRTVASFRRFLEEHHDEIEALQILYSRPYRERLTYKRLKDLAHAIERPPYLLAPQRVWDAYAALEQSRVRGSGGQVLTDLVSLVRYTLQQDDELVPYRDLVHRRFDTWLTEQRAAGREFSTDQLAWLERFRDHIATSLAITPEDLEYAPFNEHGGWIRASRDFNGQLPAVLDELTEALAA